MSGLIVVSAIKSHLQVPFMRNQHFHNLKFRYMVAECILVNFMSAYMWSYGIFVTDRKEAFLQNLLMCSGYGGSIAVLFRCSLRCLW